MVNHPNRSKSNPVTFTVYDTQDSSWFRDGLTESEAETLCTEQNVNNSRYGDRYEILEDAIFIASFQQQSEQAGMIRDDD